MQALGFVGLFILAVAVQLFLRFHATRFVAELIGGYAAVWGALVAVGGILGVAAFLVFAFGLWQTSGRAASVLRSNRTRDAREDVRSDSGAVSHR